MNLLQASLGGSAAFREPEYILENLTSEVAAKPVPGLPYTIADVLYHLNATMRASLDLASGRAADWPEGLEVWPDMPPSTEQHSAEQSSAEQLAQIRLDVALALSEAVMLAEDPSERAREILTDLAVNNAYHWGQVALIRRLHGDWSGEDPVTGGVVGGGVVGG
ncbi:damage-inducible protein DinB [Deinococcus sp. Arct2-2]|uniref:damage-inducible protein DinB n=1 Tax=Deinococcus sp. Arct2-2 TaxID=2568653 RepID=UPI0010A49F58|nr:damage-inducible protein DinB [Deinococcus sp. Arct2-2]THF70058.1 damage-inducible protein DinB [Deinococcus sp. Arct2-2]